MGITKKQFFSHLDFQDDHWIWPVGDNGHGYRRILSYGTRALSHRWAYEAFVGPIPEGFNVHHKCEVKACCNPEHLEILSISDHMRYHQGGDDVYFPCGHEREGNEYKTKKGAARCKVCAKVSGLRVKPIVNWNWVVNDLPKPSGR